MSRRLPRAMPTSGRNCNGRTKPTAATSLIAAPSVTGFETRSMLRGAGPSVGRLTGPQPRSMAERSGHAESRGRAPIRHRRIGRVETNVRREGVGSPERRGQHSPSLTRLGFLIPEQASGDRAWAAPSLVNTRGSRVSCMTGGRVRATRRGAVSRPHRRGTSPSVSAGRSRPGVARNHRHAGTADASDPRG